MSGIPTGKLIRTGLRLALYQATWCEGSMQSVGLAYCLLPGLSELSTSKEHLKELVTIAEEPFNTHPFLAGVVAGVVLHMVGKGKSSTEIKAFLHGAMGPLAAIGDPFLRGALPVFVAALASLMAMFAGVAAGVITLVLLFNSVHLFIRVGGFIMGYRNGISALGEVGRLLSHAHGRFLKRIAAVGVGAVLVKSVQMFGQPDGVWITVALTAVAIGAAFGLIKLKSRRVHLVPVLLALAILVEVLI